MANRTTGGIDNEEVNPVYRNQKSSIPKIKIKNSPVNTPVIKIMVGGTWKLDSKKNTSKSKKTPKKNEWENTWAPVGEV